MTNKTISMVTSPAALVLWPKLNEPNTRFNEAGEYEATLVFDPKNNDHQKFLDNLERMYEEAVASMAEEHKKPKIKRADSPIRPLLDKDDNETGMMKVKFKLTASGETKDGHTIDILGCTGQELRDRMAELCDYYNLTKKYGEFHFDKTKINYHIDHFLPLKPAVEITMEERYKRLHWTNCRPMPPEANIAKGNRPEEGPSPDEERESIRKLERKTE